MTVLLNAACVAINLDDACENVTSLDVRSTEEKSFTVTAKRFVFAAGGVEVPRLLLSSNRQIPQGIGNQHDLVGRYFMTHISGVVATAHLCVDPATVAHEYDCDENGVLRAAASPFPPKRSGASGCPISRSSFMCRR